MAETAEQQTAEQRLERLRDALDSGRLVPVRRILKSLHPAEIARLLESLPHNERKVVWGVVDVDDQGEVLLHVNDEVRAALIQGMSPEDVIAAARDLDIDDLADFVDDLPETLTPSRCCGRWTWPTARPWKRSCPTRRIPPAA